MAELLDALIKQRKQEALDYQKYLEKIVELTKQAKNGPGGAAYPKTLNTPAKRALYDNPGKDQALALAADVAVRTNKQDDWRGNAVKVIAQWEAAMGVKVAEWGVKQMKTKWGACNIEARRIWVNLELAKKPVLCLEYIIVHEMAHLLERHHNDRLTKLMDSFMPRWRLQRAELNRAPLGHATWRC